MRRAGRIATGIDRVERAYLTHLLRDEVPLFGLVRTRAGYLLLDGNGLARFRDRLNGQLTWSHADWLSKALWRRDGFQSSAETSLRQDAIARTLPWRLAGMLTGALPAGTSYVNVGHSNITDRVLKALRRIPDVRISAMIHDVIPLEYPEYQRPGTVKPFAEKLTRLEKHADLLIYNSDATKQATEAYFQGVAPANTVAHLGVEPADPDADALPEMCRTDRPYFVTIGTIEPRKNHAFLLDLWEEMGDDAPGLMICGQRGWNNDAVFARLDALPADGPVQELPDLSDGAIAELVRTSHGALFPSLAEGFGLPPVEALAFGARVLCNNLPVYREFLGKKAIYASVAERYLWISTIKKWAQDPRQQRTGSQFIPPTWGNHFKTVLRLI